MRSFLLSFALIISAAPSWADARISVLMDLLKVDEVTEILRSEGLEYTAELDEGMLQGQGGAFFARQAEQIYNAARMAETVRAALETGLDEETLGIVIDWFSSDLGARIVALENAARKAMSDATVEEAARATFETRLDTGDPHVTLVRRYVSENDLVSRNVSGAMSSNYQFYLGLSDGKLLVQTEDEILADVYEQQGEIHEDTEGWLNGFLLLSYAPLEIQELERYVVFSASPAGQRLNAALFEGFEKVFREVSYTLGRAVALSAAGNDI